MIFLLGLNISNNLKTIIGFSKFYGLKKYTVKQMLNNLNISSDSRILNLNQNIYLKMLKWIDFNFISIENILKQKIIFSINQIKSIKAFRGLKHLKNVRSIAKYGFKALVFDINK